MFFYTEYEINDILCFLIAFGGDISIQELLHLFRTAGIVFYCADCFCSCTADRTGHFFFIIHVYISGAHIMFVIICIEINRQFPDGGFVYDARVVADDIVCDEQHIEG